MSMELLIAGGGMAGLAAATACAAAGLRPRVLDQAQAFSEVGAGVQLGPNATRRLVRWGLGPALLDVAAQPAHLCVRSAAHGGELARMPLGAEFEDRYGGPYVTIHRADLHAVLLGGAQRAGVPVELGARVESVAQEAQGVRVTLGDARHASAPVLLGADGLWSNVRQQVWQDGLARPAGHLAYRGVVAQKDLPLALRTGDVTAWLGPRLHVVTYPLRRGELMNVVAIVEGRIDGNAQDWDHAAVLADLSRAMGATCDTLRDLTQAVPAWRLWVLCDRMPLAGPQGMVRGRVALLGDAAHPMRPYLAQGACMAIEDADALAGLLAACEGQTATVPTALQRYADQRWERCARVQWRSRRNGDIFHAVGPVRWGRDTALRLLGRRILDVPWLYGPG